MKVLHLLISGHVQGVGFRQFVKSRARKLGLVGWVRNLPEGTVEAEGLGEEKALEQWIKECKKGPFLSKVQAVEVEWMVKDFPYTSFDIRHDIND